MYSSLQRSSYGTQSLLLTVYSFSSNRQGNSSLYARFPILRAFVTSPAKPGLADSPARHTARSTRAPALQSSLLLLPVGQTGNRQDCEFPAAPAYGAPVKDPGARAFPLAPPGYRIFPVAKPGGPGQWEPQP